MLMSFMLMSFVLSSYCECFCSNFEFVNYIKLVRDFRRMFCHIMSVYDLQCIGHGPDILRQTRKSWSILGTMTQAN